MNPYPLVGLNHFAYLQWKSQSLSGSICTNRDAALTVAHAVWPWPVPS